MGQTDWTMSANIPRFLLRLPLPRRRPFTNVVYTNKPTGPPRHQMHPVPRIPKSHRRCPVREMGTDDFVAPTPFVMHHLPLEAPIVSPLS